MSPFRTLLSFLSSTLHFYAAVLGVADQVVNAVKSGDLKHIFLIGGCDGAEGQRNYFKEVATNVPDDCLILTLACGKYRFNKVYVYDFRYMYCMNMYMSMTVHVISPSVLMRANVCNFVHSSTLAPSAIFRA